MSTILFEEQEQELFCRYLTINNFLFTATLNGVFLNNHKQYVEKLKKQGLNPGFPDLIIFAKNQSKTHEVMMIEMKRQKGGKMSYKQKEWFRKLDEADYCVGCAFGCDSAIRILNLYLRS